jgi:hypothetical protein
MHDYILSAAVLVPDDRVGPSPVVERERHSEIGSSLAMFLRSIGGSVLLRGQ